MSLINPSPIINNAPQQLSQALLEKRTKEENDENFTDEIDQYEIYDIIRTIKDPEYPLTLEQLNVVRVENIKVDNEKKIISVDFTPTVPNCSYSALIGLCIKVKLMNTINRKYKIDVKVEEGKHDTEDAINKQLNDKERVYAALEADTLKRVISRSIYSEEEFGSVYC